jgi:hypothetical protein
VAGRSPASDFSVSSTSAALDIGSRRRAPPPENVTDFLPHDHSSLEFPHAGNLPQATIVGEDLSNLFGRCDSESYSHSDASPGAVGDVAGQFLAKGFRAAGVMALDVSEHLLVSEAHHLSSGARLHEAAQPFRDRAVGMLALRPKALREKQAPDAKEARGTSVEISPAITS